MTERAKSTWQIPVAIRAVMQRVNRRLATEGKRLKTVRKGQRYRAEIGPYFVVSLKTGRLIEIRIDLEGFARQLGALSDWEKITNEKGNDNDTA